ncbi:hypothetical protein K3495_g1534 [Podosphaera aphanis]|nr:hypothetical protein K3495_g1534 [Podosphaera aphanis]
MQESPLKWHLNGTRRGPASKSHSLSGSDLTPSSPPLGPKETGKQISRDDCATENIPFTPRRAGPRHPGLSLLMPSCEASEITPSSPRSDQSQAYGFPTSVLPRRSRGLDFSRAATNLHHSTLAEQSSPESSPTVACRGAINIPNRKNNLNLADGGDFIGNSSSLWSKVNHFDRMNVSSSLGSIRMMPGSESSDNYSDEDELMDDIDDSILTTLNQDTPVLSWSVQPSDSSRPIHTRRVKSQSRKNRNISSTGNPFPTLSPMAKSPPIFHNLEGITREFGKEESPDLKHPRRRSLSWEANHLRISGNENDEGALKIENTDSSPITPGREGQRGVVRRPVTRRGNMLPKTKGFARIQAALAEEVAPVETEVRREAEVVRQTRENEKDFDPRHCSAIPSSPSMTPESEIPSNNASEIKELMLNPKSKSTVPQLPNYVNTKDEILLGSPMTYTTPLLGQPSDNRSSSPSLSDTPQLGTGPTAAEITQKLNKKRRRDDFDLTSLKRRAVSPGISTHNSPIIQSPLQRDCTLWGSRKPSNSGHGDAGKSLISASAKRIGLQGIVDTNEGLMKMSIE